MGILERKQGHFGFPMMETQIILLLLTRRERWQARPKDLSPKSNPIWNLNELSPESSQGRSAARSF
jgi:hypothetical protein